MATFLELVRDVARETGTLAGGTTLASVASTSGRAEKMVSWTRKAWLNIQMERPDWIWMRTEFSSTVLGATIRHAATSFGITRLGAWARDRCGFLPYSIYDPAIGASDETSLAQLDWDSFKAKYLRGSHDPGRPIEYAISPAREFCVGPTPDQAYSINGEYRIQAQQLLADGDIPECPEEYHGAIVWEAIKLLANSDEALVSVASSLSEYAVARNRLERDQLPQIAIGFGGGPIDG